MFGFTNNSTKVHMTTTTQEKSFISQAEANNYANGGNKESTTSFKTYMEAISRLDTVIRTAASVASSAFIEYGKVDSKNKFKLSAFKQADGLYMNDYQTEGDWIFELFGTLLTYDKVLLIPEESKYAKRSGMIDWVIVPDNNFEITVGTNQTIEKFTYISTTGARTDFAYEDCVYISRNLTASNLVYAIPRLKALTSTIENILGITDFISAYITSGGKNSIIAASDTMLSEAQAREVRKELTKFLNSSAPRAMILNSEKFNLSKVSDSLTTSGVLDIITALSNEISKAFNMPSYLLGEYSSSTQGQTMVYANRTWFEITLRPLFTTVSAALTRHFRDAFGIKNAAVRFNFSNIALLEDSDTEKLDIVERSIKLGTMSINEGRTMMGMEELDADAANLHHVAAYLLGVNPVSYENFEADIARNAVDTPTTTPSTDTVPVGDGGTNNTEDLGGRA